MGKNTARSWGKMHKAGQFSIMVQRCGCDMLWLWLIFWIFWGLFWILFEAKELHPPCTCSYRWCDAWTTLYQCTWNSGGPGSPQKKSSFVNELVKGWVTSVEARKLRMDQLCISWGFADPWLQRDVVKCRSWLAWGYSNVMFSVCYAWSWHFECDIVKERWDKG